VKWTSLLFFAAFAAVVSLFVWLARRDWTPRVSGPLRSECYVWQRSWDGAVKDAVRTAPEAVAGLAPLCAEVGWRADGKLSAAWPNLDLEALRAGGKPVSAVLRIGPRVPSIGAQAEICRVAREIMDRFHREKLEPVELQVDFDCAESQLAGYRTWLTAIRAVVAPVPVRPTVLPSWLAHEDFMPLVKECGAYILQVHATAQPRVDAPDTALCETADARRWVAQAGRLGIPFRVALPTYTYRVAFDVGGRMLGIEAEGAPHAWPAGTKLRDFRPDAAQVAAMVGDWMKDRPSCLTGLLWYRLPVAADTRNWRWSTLAAVMQGHAPHADLRVEKSGVAPIDLALVNGGESEAALPLRVVVKSGSAIEAADGVGGYRAEITEKTVTFSRTEPTGAASIPPGTRHPLGWVRTASEIQILPP
jgi:hypothetical protein